MHLWHTSHLHGFLEKLKLHRDGNDQTMLCIGAQTCPSSSNAMTTTAAPYLLMSLAFLMKSSSPSFRLILLTTHLPWAHWRPASMTSNFDESIHSGTYTENKEETCCLKFKESDTFISKLILLMNVLRDCISWHVSSYFSNMHTLETES